MLRAKAIPVVCFVACVGACQPAVHWEAGYAGPYLDSSPIGGSATAPAEAAARAREGEEALGGGRGATRSEPAEGPHRFKPLAGPLPLTGNFVMLILEPGIDGLPGEGFHKAPDIRCDGASF